MSRAQDASSSTVAMETESETYPAPIIHGVELSFNYAEAGIYDALRQVWYDRVGSAENEPDGGLHLCDYDPDFLTGDESEYGLFLSSSGWKAGVMNDDGEYTQYYEYKLKLRQRDGNGGWSKPPISSVVTLAPQTTELVYPDGNDFPLPFGEGTQVSIQTTYPESGNEVILRSVDLLSQVIDFNPGSWISESARIRKLETHLRFLRERKDAAVECLNRSEQLIAWGGGSEIQTWKRRKEEGWLEARTASDRWDLLGFDEVEYETQIKVYQINDWYHRDSDDALHHPKIESEYRKGDRDAHPQLDDWDELVHELRQKVIQHAQWAGIDPTDLVEDSFYSGADEELVEAPCLEGRREDLRARYNDLELPIYGEVTKSSTKAPYDILDALKRNHGATYDTLEAETGLSRSMIRKHVKRFEDLGFVERIGNPVLVVFAAPYVEDMVTEITDKEAPDTLSRQRLDREDRIKERQESRESSGTDADEDTADTTTQRRIFKYICDVGITAEQLSLLLAAGNLSEQDVRVRDIDGLEDSARALA